MERLSEKIRVSLGSSILLNLTPGVMDVRPTTIYLLTFHQNRCEANCSFCAQSKSSKSSSDKLSRIIWPIFSSNEVIDRMREIEKQLIERVCIQAMNYKSMFEEVLELVKRISANLQVPISVSCQPLTAHQMNQLKEAGVDRIGIPLDTATEKNFDKIKGSVVNGPYSWKTHMIGLENAVLTFGRGKVSTHLIVGLGETDEEILTTVQKMIDRGVYPALFAFTPIYGTKLERKHQPKIERYRCIQLAHHLITKHEANLKDIAFDGKGHIEKFKIDSDLLGKAIKTGVPFMTAGCPGCNRPYYNERASGPLYNYPRKLEKDEINKVENGIWRYLNG